MIHFDVLQKIHDMKPRAAAVIVDQGKLLLIHRVKESEDYWVLPGGSVEEDETPEEACCREVREEVGLEIEILKLFAKLLNRNREEIYFSAKRRSGSLALGGPELARNSKSNRYEPKWVDLKRLPELNLLPAKIRTIMAEQIGVGNVAPAGRRA